MSPADIRELLAFARGYGLPEPDDAAVTAWHHALHQLDLDEATIAVIDHYRETSDDVRPADIWRRCRVPEAPRAPERPRRRPDPERWHRMWEQALAMAAREGIARRHLVLGIKPSAGDDSPPLAMRLCDPPLNYPNPKQWNGYIPPEVFNGERNNAARREALLAIVADAEAATSASQSEEGREPR